MKIYAIVLTPGYFKSFISYNFWSTGGKKEIFTTDINNAIGFFEDLEASNEEVKDILNELERKISDEMTDRQRDDHYEKYGNFDREDEEYISQFIDYKNIYNASFVKNNLPTDIEEDYDIISFDVTQEQYEKLENVLEYDTKQDIYDFDQVIELMKQFNINVDSMEENLLKQNIQIKEDYSFLNAEYNNDRKKIFIIFDAEYEDDSLKDKENTKFSMGFSYIEDMENITFPGEENFIDPNKQKTKITIHSLATDKEIIVHTKGILNMFDNYREALDNYSALQRNGNKVAKRKVQENITSQELQQTLNNTDALTKIYVLFDSKYEDSQTVKEQKIDASLGYIFTDFDNLDIEIDENNEQLVQSMIDREGKIIVVPLEGMIDIFTNMDDAINAYQKHRKQYNNI